MAKFKIKLVDCQLSVRVKLSGDEIIDELVLRNLTQKYVRGLLKIREVNRKKIEYVGPVGISLIDRLKGPVNKFDFFFIVEQFVDLCRKIELSKLDINKVVMDLREIYINEMTKEVQFIYLPLKGVQRVNLFQTMYSLIYNAKPIDEFDNTFVSKFNSFLRSMQYFDLDKIENYIMNEDKNVVNIIRKHSVGQSGFMTDKPKDYYEHYEKKQEKSTGFLSDEDATGLLSEEEEATGLLTEEEEATGLLIEEEEEETTFLFEVNNVRIPLLKRINTDETIRIDKQVFRVGKEKSYCDYFVNNNSAVSRSHADIITRGEKFYIMDLNSTNRTFINGAAIAPRQEVELHDGDNIRLGNEEFVFNL